MAEVDDEGTAFSVRKLDDLLQGKDVTTSLPGPVALHIGSTSVGLFSRCQTFTVRFLTQR